MFRTILKLMTALVVISLASTAFAQQPAGVPAPPTPSPPGAGGAPPWPGRILRQPPILHGEDVRQWQTQMRARGWTITADGAYGPQSERVCRQFQAEKTLTVDGQVGPVTWAAAWTAPVT